MINALRYGRNVSIYLIPFCHGALHVARTGSVYVTMSVTLERYFAIVHPLKHFTVKKYLLPVTILFAFVYNIPKVRRESALLIFNVVISVAWKSFLINLNVNKKNGIVQCQNIVEIFIYFMY